MRLRAAPSAVPRMAETTGLEQLIRRPFDPHSASRHRNSGNPNWDQVVGCAGKVINCSAVSSRPVTSRTVESRFDLSSMPVTTT